jgi:carotenoid 1,2-hydratase
VFSPYYARARRRDLSADPLQHCALNVALYGPSGKRWAMTERNGAQVSRSADSLHLGPSSLTWEEDALIIRIDERTAPWPSRLHGVIRLHPAALVDRTYALDMHARHHWCPIAPHARVEVDLGQPELRWSGTGYLDSNAGSRPLEDDFCSWDWSRSGLQAGRTTVLYDVQRRTGDPLSLALQFDASGGVQPIAAPPAAALPGSAWRMARSARSDTGTAPRVTRTLEDGPFYARSVLEATWLGQPVTAVHETLSLQRFSANWVHLLLPFRMPRRAQ